MTRIKKILVMIRSIPNTVRFNFHYFPFNKAIHFPVLVSYKVSLRKLGKKGSLKCPNNFASVKLGFSDGSYFMGTGKKSTFEHEIESQLSFQGSATMCNPFYLTIKHGAKIVIGDNFQSNTNFILNASKCIEIGKDSLIAWNVTILDGDGHFITNENNEEILNYPKEIYIGNHNWIASGGTILKGSILADNIIVSANAVISGKFETPNIIIGGVPAKVIKKDIAWKVDWIK